MTSWVYLFSKFTAEALLFEGLAITLLCAGYAGFWILRKRRLGVIQNDVPVGVVKTYLNELIFDAEQLRAQLFGLLAANGIRLTQSPSVQLTAAAAPTTVTVQDPEILKKVAFLESKMAEQAQAMSSLLAEKARIEKELAEARAKGAAAPGAGGDPNQFKDLKDKVQNLEAKLAEYSVIEDDLANLKRLQQENLQLKAALGGAPAPGAKSPAAEAAPAKAAPAPKAPEPAMEEPSPVAAVPAEFAAASADSAFEGLVDHVEKSLEPEAPSAAVAAAETPLESTSVPQPVTVSKSDEDLVAEFEKMLSS